MVIVAMVAFYARRQIKNQSVYQQLLVIDIRYSVTFAVGVPVIGSQFR